MAEAQDRMTLYVDDSLESRYVDAQLAATGVQYRRLYRPEGWGVLPALESRGTVLRGAPVIMSCFVEQFEKSKREDR
ncbi:MAG: hypothetical protein HY332_23275 [Chloroflexi bacterium]|nr:hypothetical protein [Chloroflexota bacterium]